MKTAELSTPTILVDRDRLDANLRRMQERADREAVALRPHIKTHKSPRIAAMQRDLGARGITVATVGEAEVFAEAGFGDIRVAYPLVGKEKHARLLALLRDGTRVSFLVDTVEGARMAAPVYADSGVEVPVLVKVDVGYGRVGIRWDDPSLVQLGETAAGLPGFRLVGILTHAGHSYHGPRERESESGALRRYADLERDRMLEAAGRFSAAGLAGEGFEVSVGSTPTASVFENREEEGFSVTELRPGTYAFFDVTQAALGSCRLEDCAATVLATVVSRHEEEDGRVRVILDAGKKILTAEKRHGSRGHGILLPPPEGGSEPIGGAELFALSEEHGWLRTEPGVDLRIGDQVRIVPNHVCVVINTQDEFHLVEGDEVVETVPVEARGRVR
ncbi:MAG: hypothetical protein GWM92_10415 [Gemmatimonadetes bacterium]|nr:hypothetical protein [Gemmatimonadota bacterium]NIR79096.1 hypothetical protein [Gemmatimonadota bacterium]NIT87755.1 hypothetical protein [Gemmatimonadota bacterium]NIU31615.1 hypothetical protein [Gemmatimonadota bacterium]NIU36249.1 hypothetical protein [Gemmatimonadota bacterium]